MNYKLKQDMNAVSPVIGVILMVAITVVLAAIVFVLVSHLANVPDAAPVVSLSTTDAGATFTVVSVSEKDLQWSDFTDANGGCTLPVGTVTAGDSITDCDGLTLVYKDTNVVYQYP